MDERKERIGLNEALFRSVNERIRDVNDAFAAITEVISIMCECGNRACAERIDVDLESYERIRADPALFAVVPGHVIPDTEQVVERRGRYEIVRKHPGDEAALAEATDPRQSQNADR